LLSIFGLSNNATVQDVLDLYNENYGLEGNALKINQEQLKNLQTKYGT
jgi:hypothetical protein